MSGLGGCTRTRAICCVSARPRNVQVLPPSVVFQTPSPCDTLPRIGNCGTGVVPILRDVSHGDGAAEILIGHRQPRVAPIGALEDAAARGAEPVLVRAGRRAGDGHAAAAAENADLAPGETGENRRVVRLGRRGARGDEQQDDGGERQRANGHGGRPPQGGEQRPPRKHGKAEPRKGAYGLVIIPPMSSGFSVMDDFASLPWDVSTIPPPLRRVLISPNGTSEEAHTSASPSKVMCNDRNVPAGTVTDSHPTTSPPLHRLARSSAEAPSPPFLPTMLAI